MTGRRGPMPADPLLAELVAHRYETGMSQQAVADAMGTTRTQVAKIESGQRSPRLDTVHRYAAAVGRRLLTGPAGGTAR